jgi:hypothetical protein
MFRKPLILFHLYLTFSHVEKKSSYFYYQTSCHVGEGNVFEAQRREIYRNEVEINNFHEWIYVSGDGRDIEIDG